MTFDERTVEIAAKRRATHPGQNSHYGDPMEVQSIGVAGERFVAKHFGWYYDEAEHTEHPEGDGGIDFTIHLPRRAKPLTIDVKTAQLPYYLLIKEHDIGRGAELLIQCLWTEKAGVSFVGWEWRSVMAWMPVRDFGYGPNYCRRRGKLHHIDELSALVDRWSL